HGRASRSSPRRRRAPPPAFPPPPSSARAAAPRSRVRSPPPSPRRRRGAASSRRASASSFLCTSPGLKARSLPEICRDMNPSALILWFTTLLIGGAVSPVAAEDRPIILATTTSTQDSGLLDVLVPMFEKEKGATVKTVAIGTG